MAKIMIVNPGENLQDKLFRVNKKSNLILKPGPRCFASQVELQTNYPIKKGSKFNRSKYYSLPVSNDHQDLISSAFNWSVSLTLEMAGTFHFICSTPDEGEIWQAYVVVNPEMKVPLDSIRCQTVLSKNLGPLSEWRKRLTLTKDCKYNMVHFTPVQELGGSNSAYSIKNQLKVNKLFGASLDGIKKEVDFMEKKWQILSITDIVLNHTSNDSEWIYEHPECAYNVANSPHLRPAFLLDSAFIWLMQDIINGSLKGFYGLTSVLETEQDLQNIAILLKTFYVPQMKIYELFLLDIQDALARFQTLERGETLEVEMNYRRNSNKVKRIPDSIDSTSDLKTFIEVENLKRIDKIRGFLDYAINNALNAIGYERLNPAGPYYRKPLDENMPIVAPYFTHTELAKFKIKQEELLMETRGDQFMAHNGWVMGCNYSEDFASPNSMVYLKRELIAWGDCIKLRFGSSREEIPYLWGHIQEYVERQARTFHGFRIDNCHSTPLHVAEFVVDVARSVRSDIYIMAELFTSSESADNIFVNRLGISSLIRESMSAQDARELGRLMYRYGGTPVGAFYQHGDELLRPSMAHAIFFDQTHDNESPIIRRSPFDVSATTAIINMANCATGSNRGYDELVPHHINVVAESRLYQPEVEEDIGILPLRRFINGPLQRELSQGFDEIFVDQVNDDTIAMTRHNPTDGRSIVLVARTAFSKEFGPCPTPIIPIQGRVRRVIFEAQAAGDPSRYIPNSKFINGLSSFKTKIISQDCSPNQSQLANFSSSEVRLEQFLPSSVLAFELTLTDVQTEALRILNQWDIDTKISFMDANYILFRTPEEDKVGTYELPDIGKFTYCGLYGLMYHLEQVRDNQDQAHPLTMNLRQGNWLSEYIVDRLRNRGSTAALADNLEVALRHVNLLPRGMVPKYFDLILTRLYNFVLDSIYSSLSPFVSKGPSLVKLLTLSSFALIGECESAQLPEVDSKLQYVPSIAAGLPHFASGYMRNWGRDTFISIRGLLLITGRFLEAKSVILSYARTLKNGLIPNLLDGGSKSRYNCRDAVWWWLYSIREYTKLAPNGNEILRCKVKRIHKPQRKKSIAQTNGVSDASVTMSLSDVIQEALECHFKGLEFEEENAGKELDEHMHQKGFKVSFGVNRDTGFVYGGNKYNCGTWMDKMGSSEKAGTKGKPASPRDGSAIEIIGLSKSVVNWLDEMFSKGRLYPYDGVECLYDNTITLKWTWKKWASLIQTNFEKHFYIPLKNEEELPVDPTPELINRRGIYKDTVGALERWQDYQLRPNFLIAMVVAPELFDTKHAKHALKLAKEILCSPLGMKTLDPTDWNYCGDYDNSNDSINPKVAHGFNYHQGPEWLWLTGYYIRASSKFVGASERQHHLEILSNFYSTLTDSPWLGLPELTNLNGKPCPDSCQIQAWSVATAIETLYESARTG